jgi:AcrR family transcriptional regulator
MKQQPPTKNKTKTDALFHYLVANGFEHSLDKIAFELHLTQRALIYRYGSKEAMFLFIMNYWRKQWQRCFKAQAEDCNQIVEKLLLFILRLRESYTDEYPFFLRENEEKNFLNSAFPHSFLSLLKTLLTVGINQGYFEEINIDIYAKLLLYNIINVFIIEDEPFDYLEYIFRPLLTEKGKKALDAVDVERFFENSRFSLP